ncbi:MAG: electron transfer flavoprotein subunit beta/FixA family protein [Thaumarchaeota archaeon]|nr:electron transfer flavoprotein subunit beta/FixA family protein [Nitrososphaerota archaeon]
MTQQPGTKEKKNPLEIIVCFKHVIDETELRIDRANNKINFEGAKTKISDDDKNAIEEAVRIKEKNGGIITVVCVGPADAKKSTKEALAMGCDRARLIVDPSFQDGDALSTAYILSQVVKKIGKFDLILTSTGTTDSYTGIVGPALAEYLDLPQLTYASKITISGNKLTVDRALDDGIETVECEIPALVTVSREINQPRFPTLIQIMSAGKKELLEWNAQTLGINPSVVGKADSKVEVKSLSVPKSARKKVIFEGKPEDAAKQLAEALLKEGAVK